MKPTIYAWNVLYYLQNIHPKLIANLNQSHQGQGRHGITQMCNLR